MVGPLYRDPRPAAQLLISSTAHQSLVHDPPSRKVSLSLSLSLSFAPGPHIAAANLAVPLEGYLENADGSRSEEKRRGRVERVYLCFGIRGIFQE